MAKYLFSLRKVQIRQNQHEANELPCDEKELRHMYTDMLFLSIVIKIAFFFLQKSIKLSIAIF